MFLGASGASAEIGQIAFQVAADAESAVAQFAFNTAEKNQVFDTSENKKTVDATAVTSLTVKGAPPL